MHADVRGASSVVIRNKVNGGEIPPKTLNEAGSMAVCYSSSWEAKVIAAAWWVYHHQACRSFLLCHFVGVENVARIACLIGPGYII